MFSQGDQKKEQDHIDRGRTKHINLLDLIKKDQEKYLSLE